MIIIIAAKLNKNLLEDLPTIGLKLQDEFHSAINSFGTGQSGAALTKLKVYAGSEHPHAAQNPKVFEFNQVSQIVKK